MTGAGVPEVAGVAPEVAGGAAAVADAGSAVAEVAAGAGAAAVAVGGGAADDEAGAGRDPPAHPATRTAASTEPIAIGDRFLTLALSPLRRRAGKRGRDKL